MSLFRGISNPSLGSGQSVANFVSAAVAEAVAAAFSVRDIQILNLQQRVTNLENDTGGGGVTPPAPTPPPAPAGVAIDINFADFMTGDSGPLSITGVNFTRASAGYAVFDHEGVLHIPESGELYISGGRRNDAGTGDHGWGATGIQWFSDDATDGDPIASTILLGFRPKPGCTQLARHNRDMTAGSWTKNDGDWASGSDAKIGTYTSLSNLAGNGVSAQFSNGTPGGALGLIFLARQNGGTTGTLALQNLLGPSGGRWYINTALLPQADADFAIVTRDHPAVTVDTEFTAQAGDGFNGIRIKDDAAAGNKGLHLSLLTVTNNGSNATPPGLVENTTGSNVTIADEVFYIDNSEVGGTAGTWLFATDAPAAGTESLLAFDQADSPGLRILANGSASAVLTGGTTKNTGIPTDDDYFSVALTYDSNGFALAMNNDGILSGDSTQMPSLTGDAYLGEADGAAYLSRPIKRIAYWDERVTDTELENLAVGNYLAGGAGGSGDVGGGEDPGGGDPDPGGGDPGGSEILLANPNSVLMQFMTTTNNANSSNARFGWRPWARNGATTQVASWAAIAAATSNNRGDLGTYSGGADLLVGWTWINKGTDPGTYSEPQVAGLSGYVLDQRDDTWKRVWGPLALGTASRWNGSDNTGTYVSAVSRGTTSGGAPISGMPSDFDSYGLEFWQAGYANSVGAQINATLIQNAKCYAVVGWCRKALKPGAGVDDRAVSEFFIQQGFDVMNSKHPAYPSHNVNPGSAFSRPSTTYPGSAIDGGNSSWYLIPYSAEYPDRWYPFGVVSVTNPLVAASLRNPWAAAVGASEWTVDSSHAEIGGITSTQFLSSGFVMPAI